MIDDVTASLYVAVFADLLDGSILRMQPGERLWKLYFLRPNWGRQDRIEHRIYTKEQADGKVALVSYNLTMPPGSRPAKSNLAYAGDIHKDTLDQIIWNVVRKSGIGIEELEVVDLSHLPTFQAQVRYLRGLDQADAEVSSEPAHLAPTQPKPRSQES